MIVPFSQTGEFEDAAMGDGLGFTVTVVVPDFEQPLEPVTITVYMPLAGIVTFGIVGLGDVELKPRGPDQR